MNFACALLLLVLKEEEEAYWALSALVESLVPNYFDELVIGSVVDQCVLAALLQDFLPDIAAQIKSLGVELPIICMQWFNSLFIETMPFSSVVCVWDALLSEGAVAIVRVALTLFDQNSEAILQSGCLEQLILGIRRSLNSSFGGLELLESCYREGSVGSSVSWDFMQSLRTTHEKQVLQSLAHYGVPWRPGLLDDEDDELNSNGAPVTPESLPGSFVQSMTEAATDIRTQGVSSKMPAALQSASNTVGDVAVAAWGGLSRLFSMPYNGNQHPCAIEQSVSEIPQQPQLLTEPPELLHNR